MMETEQRAASCHAPGQTSVRTWLSPSTRGATRTPSDSTSRFHGDGVRYKAKLIGVDPVPNAKGDKMCWDSMMKLKGFEAAARKQGKHKQRVWLKVSSTGLRIIDERIGAVLYDHDRSRITSLTKDESDPRALAYVYQHQDTYSLFYIKTANLADPVLADIEAVCQILDQETPRELAEELTQGPAFEDVFGPRPDSPAGQLNQASSSNELMEVFSIQMEEPLMPSQSSCISQPESPQPMLSTSQILSMFPTQPAGGSPYSSPPYSPTTMPWGHQGLLGNQWAGPAAASWPTMPSTMPAWAPAGIAVSPAEGQILCSQPGGNTPTSPTAVNRSDSGGRFYGNQHRMLAEGESVDVKAIRARFNNKTSTSDTSSRDSSSPKSPRPGFGRLTENDMAHHRLSPTVPPPMAGPGLVRFPRAEATAASRPVPFPQLPPNPGFRASIQPADPGKVKLKGEMLQNMMLRHQKPPGTRSAQGPAQAPAPAPTSNPLPIRQQHRQRSAGEVTPLRRPLPPEGPLPLKPKRPPSVNLEPFLRFNRGPALPSPRKSDGSSSSADRKMSLPTVISPPKPPQRSNKPSRLPRQIASVDIEDNQDFYDDIASFEKNESWSDNSSQCIDGENDDVYEFIDEDQLELNWSNVEKQNKKEAKKQWAQDKKDQMERQKKENELRKNFQLQGEVEVLHTARVRHDWHGGGKLDLSVQQGESVEILRVKNNPGGKWLARSLNGNYGYIINTCVDIDYEAVKRKVLQSRKIDSTPLPPPPPDPPLMLNVESNGSNSMLQDDDDYDDVQPITEDFPPPPPEISIDPKVEKELKKRFKYDGPLRVLHTMMIDPNSIIKKPGGKDLPVTQGEVVDIIQLTNSKKALCCNRFGKYGYVSRSLLLPMEGDIYDDVDYAGDVYDNDSPHTDY